MQPYSHYSAALGAAILLMAMVVAGPARSADVTVPVTNDLGADARLSVEHRLPILLVFAAEDCGYCDQLEREILKPILISGDYNDKVIIRKVVIHNGSRVRDFGGKRISTDELARRYKVFVTPTMLFLGAGGQELTPRMVGINTVDFFAGEVDRSIDASLEMLRRDRSAANNLAQVNEAR